MINLHESDRLGHQTQGCRRRLNVVFLHNCLEIMLKLGRNYVKCMMVSLKLCINLLLISESMSVVASYCNPLINGANTGWISGIDN